jgi:hypothetical protein
MTETWLLAALWLGLALVYRDRHLRGSGDRWTKG